MRPAKLFKLLMTLLFVLMICSACQNNREEGQGNYISLDELTGLSDKGGALSWSDLDKYAFEDAGSGIYIRKYPVEGGAQLVLSGKSLEIPPERIYMVNPNGEELDFTQTTN